MVMVSMWMTLFAMQVFNQVPMLVQARDAICAGDRVRITRAPPGHQALNKTFYHWRIQLFPVSSK
eukprot:9438794-Pyramimonas_sp.AAC.1